MYIIWELYVQQQQLITGVEQCSRLKEKNLATIVHSPLTLSVVSKSKWYDSGNLYILFAVHLVNELVISTLYMKCIIYQLLADSATPVRKRLLTSRQTVDSLTQTRWTADGRRTTFLQAFINIILDNFWNFQLAEYKCVNCAVLRNLAFFVTFNMSVI